VQVVALKSERAVERWLTARALTGMSAARIANGDEIFYIVLLGVYPDFASAQRAVDERPPPLRDLTPWIRPLRALQAAIRAAEAGSG
jgi:septal ring-binding cell division protein DamX